jgi:Fe2+ transport system protein FeoA
MTATCPLCGFTYEPGSSACLSSGCPLASKACRKLHCPRCGYAVPDEGASVLARWVRRLFSTPAVQAADTTDGTRPLADLPTGTRGAIARIGGPSMLEAQLAAQGVVPGTVLRLAQRHPAFVIEVGETTLAFEGAVARAVWVRPGDPAIADGDPVDSSTKPDAS